MLLLIYSFYAHLCCVMLINFSLLDQCQSFHPSSKAKSYIVHIPFMAFIVAYDGCAWAVLISFVLMPCQVLLISILI